MLSTVSQVLRDQLVKKTALVKGHDLNRNEIDIINTYLVVLVLYLRAEVKGYFCVYHLFKIL